MSGPPAMALFGLDPGWTAGTILVLAYAGIMSERVNRAVVAGVGACAVILLGLLSQDDAFRAIDLNTIALLLGMMLIVGITRHSGLFQYVAIRSVQVARGSPAAVMALLALAAAGFSAILDNVTTVLLMAPVTLALTAELEVPAFPFLFAQVFASNIGGTSTLVGDPPNILIGSAAGLSFNDFVVNLLPPVVVAVLLTGGLGHLVWGRRLVAPAEARARVLAAHAHESITDRATMVKALGVLALMVSAFVLARPLGLEAGTIAMSGAALLIVLTSWGRTAEEQTAHLHQNLADVEWITLFFFIGLFILVAAVQHAGLLDRIANAMVAATHGDRRTLMIAILWGSALLSAVLDNIPFVATMIPVIQALAPGLGGAEAVRPLWWALALGACLGGNGTLVGASANLTVAGIAERAGTPFGFRRFTRPAFPMMLLTVAVAHVWLVFRY